MITIDKINNRVQLNKCVFKMENYYIYWQQRVRFDGTLTTIGYFYWAKRCSKGWDKVLRDRIIKMFLGKEKKVITQTTNRT